jgi:hypothetical protein
MRAAGGTEYFTVALRRVKNALSQGCIFFSTYTAAAFYIVRATFTRAHCRNQSSLHNNAGAQMHSRKVLTKRYF